MLTIVLIIITIIAVGILLGILALEIRSQWRLDQPAFKPRPSTEFENSNEFRNYLRLVTPPEEWDGKGPKHSRPKHWWKARKARRSMQDDSRKKNRGS